jgi:uncharacterized protein YdcH (DUF465 family)
MPTVLREVREHLMASNPEFQKLAQQHSQYESQLESLSKEPYLNGETISQLATLKKMKLRVKDEMERIVAQYARQFDNS